MNEQTVAEVEQIRKDMILFLEMLGDPDIRVRFPSTKVFDRAYKNLISLAQEPETPKDFVAFIETVVRLNEKWFFGRLSGLSKTVCAAMIATNLHTPNAGLDEINVMMQTLASPDESQPKSTKKVKKEKPVVMPLKTKIGHEVMEEFLLLGLSPMAVIVYNSAIGLGHDEDGFEVISPKMVNFPRSTVFICERGKDGRANLDGRFTPSERMDERDASQWLKHLNVVDQRKAGLLDRA